jgi:hypothetical protein
VPCQRSKHPEEALHKPLSKINGNAEFKLGSGLGHGPQLAQERPTVESTASRDSAPANFNSKPPKNIITDRAGACEQTLNPPLCQGHQQGSPPLPEVHHHSEVI